MQSAVPLYLSEFFQSTARPH